MKFKYVVVNENNSDKLDIGHYRTKVKVTARLWNLVQVRKLILGVYVYLIVIYKFHKYCHAWMILRIPREC